MPRLQRLEWLIFLTCFFAFAYFNQGGGWNQNARFAEVRAIVEQGRFAIDDYLIYQHDPASDDLVRLPLDHAEFTSGSDRFRLCWVDMEWNLFPMGDRPLAPGVKKAPMVSICASGDIGYVPADGHFHPNKPPGTQLLAVPGYFVIYHLERWLGVNVDHWWYLNLNAWLTSVCSVGLISAVGCVLFYRLARVLAGGEAVPALLATFAFAFGTTFFPFATLLFDHNLTASLFIAAYYALRRSLPAADNPAGRPMAAAGLAGCFAGLAVLTNYPAGLGVIALGLFAWLKGGLNLRRALAFCAGGVGPALVLCLYSWVCYGGPFKLSNDFQSPLFHDDDALFGMFKIPRNADDWWRIWWVARVLLYSPFRGIFFLAPVLVLGLAGLVLWWRQGRRGDAMLCCGVFALFFVMNVFFNGFHAGFSAGPRYLIPGLPFLALPLVAAFRKWPRVTGALAGLSISLNLLLTVTDAENPTGVGGHTRIEDRRDDNTYNLIRQYAWPMFFYGEARPLLAEQAAQQKRLQHDLGMAREAAGRPSGEDEEDRQARKIDELQMELERVERNRATLESIPGPVSVNPLGVFEGMLQFDFFPPGSRPCQWASFNLGEFLWPASRWSVLPLLIVSGGLGALAIALARREQRGDG